MTKPLVSVVLPTYNRARLLRRALASVFHQTYSSTEILVIDDRSTDGTETYGRTFSDERVRFLRHSRNRGIAAARNTGLSAARGEFVAFLDDDDEWLETKLERQIEAFLSGPSNLGVVFTGSWKISGGRRLRSPSFDEIAAPRDIFRRMLQGRYIVLPSASMVRRRCFDAIGGFDESLKALEEWDLWIRLSRRFLFQSIPAPLVRYHSTAASVSKDRAVVARSLVQVMKKHARGVVGNPPALQNFIWNFLKLTTGRLLEKAGWGR